MRAIRSIRPDGTAELEDGTEVQLCVGNRGDIRWRPVEVKDHIAKLDQDPSQIPTTPAEIARYTDLSHLDQG